ncbi:MAG: hypothetical protein JNK55_21900 [Rubrivivax sp.]|nr:hypothetical protein [Rubrivivax sp.]
MALAACGKAAQALNEALHAAAPSVAAHTLHDRSRNNALRKYLAACIHRTVFTLGDTKAFQNVNFADYFKLTGVVHELWCAQRGPTSTVTWPAGSS